MNEENTAAVTSDDFDKGYEFIPNPTNEKEYVTVTSATTEECCKFLLEMAGGEFLDDVEGDYWEEMLTFILMFTFNILK